MSATQIIFTITPEERTRINDWLLDEVYPAIISEQKQSDVLQSNAVARDCWEQGFPYEGAIRGGLTYSFSPTSIGVATKVIYGLGDYELDLTDYDSW